MYWPFVLVFWLESLAAVSGGSSCDPISELPAIEAELVSHTPRKLVDEVIMPPIMALPEDLRHMVHSVRVKVLVDQSGSPAKVEFLSQVFSPAREEIIAGILNTARWTPAQSNSHNVCSWVPTGLNCILWIE